MNLDILQPFVSRDSSRHYLTRPFTVGEWTYATDGRIMIRVPAIPGVLPPDDDRLQNVGDKIPADLSAYREIECPPGWQDLQEEREECETCAGSGRFRECPDCHGRGQTECPECDHIKSCRTCKESGYLPAKAGEGESCEDCDGEGTIAKPVWVSLNRGKVFVNLNYLRMVSALPLPRLRFLDAREPLHFEFDGGDGALMPAHPHPKQALAATNCQWNPEPANP